MITNIYLNFPGNCAEALNYYEQHLGAKTIAKHTFDQMPEPRNIPPGLKMTDVLHARFTLGDAEVMASDGPAGHVQPMRSAYVSLRTESTPEAERIYKALTDGGEVFMPLAETFFAHRFAQLRDKFGVNWMIIHEKPMG
jgi:PhnB protein